MIETLIGQRYRIKALIGEGGMASVYSALDEKLERRVAIKIMHPHLARNTDIRERFLLEAKTVSGLDHPNIIRVYDFSGLESEQLWMVMEIMYGEDLAEYVKSFPKHRLQFVVATLITREICRALHEAHKLNVVHRDIKPENIMMLTNGQLKLMDFGIAKVSRANATQTGIFMGSPSYMSPEQIRGTDVDYRADIYSLSVLFYEIITGTLPFVGKTTAEVINRIMVGRYTPPNMLITDLPYGLNQIIIKGMQGHKEERYQSITEMAQALDTFLQNCNLRESRTELEEFTLDRPKFEARLSLIIAPKPPAPSSAPMSPEEKSPTFRSKITRFHASYEEQAKAEAEEQRIRSQNLSPLSPTGPDHVPQNSTVILDESMIPTIPPKVQAPVSMNLTIAEEPAPTPAPMLPPIQAAPSREAKAEAALAPKAAQPQDVQIRAQTIAPGRSSRQTSGNFPSPIRSSTQPPRTPQSQSSNPKTTQQRAYYREFAEDEKRKKKNNFGLVALVVLTAAIAIFIVFFGGERIARNLVRQVTGQPVPAQTTPRFPKVKKLDQVVETPTPEAAPEPAPAPAPEEDIVTTPIESTPVVIPSDGKTKPKIPSSVAPTVKPPLFTKNKPNGKPETSPTLPPAPGPGSGTSPVKKLDPSTTLASIPPEKTPDDKVPEVKTTEKEKEREKDKAAIPSKEPGILRLASLPAAEVYLDGKMYGTTNDKQIGSHGLKLDAGTYKLALKRPGYKVEEKAIQIKAGEMRQINVTLVKAAEVYQLTVQINKTPAVVVVEENKSGGRRLERLMSKTSTQINLKPGSYKVTVSHEAEVKTRTIELSDEYKSITFNAEFK